MTCAEPREELRKRRLMVLPASKHCYLIFVAASRRRASLTGMGLTPAWIQPREQSPEGVIKCLGRGHFGL